MRVSNQPFIVQLDFVNTKCEEEVVGGIERVSVLIRMINLISAPGPLWYKYDFTPAN